MKSIITPDILVTILEDIADHLEAPIKASNTKADDFALFLLNTIIEYLAKDNQKVA